MFRGGSDLCQREGCDTVARKVVAAAELCSLGSFGIHFSSKMEFQPAFPQSLSGKPGLAPAYVVRLKGTLL